MTVWSGDDADYHHEGASNDKQVGSTALAFTTRLSVAVTPKFHRTDLLCGTVLSRASHIVEKNEVRHVGNGVVKTLSLVCLYSSALSMCRKVYSPTAFLACCTICRIFNAHDFFLSVLHIIDIITSKLNLSRGHVAANFSFFFTALERRIKWRSIGYAV